MRIHVGIPARMGASRFPGKPLAQIAGKSMLEHVYKRSSLAKNISSIFIATCDDEIAASAANYGAHVVMTDPKIMRPGLRVNGDNPREPEGGYCVALPNRKAVSKFFT